LSETPINLYNNTIFNGKRIASNRFIPKNQSLLLEENELKVLRSTIKDLDINSLKIIKSLKDEHIVEGKFPVKKCYHTRDSITIDPYGDVIPCSVIKNYSYGNVRGKSIKEIWKNKNHEKFKKRLNKNFFPICSSCCHFPDNLTFGQNIKLFFGLKL
jgi:radical SAM protein with 4Fe4S-binding SPASM domain